MPTKTTAPSKALPDYLKRQAGIYRLEKARKASGFKTVRWTPVAGTPQEAAYNNREADIIGYGGAAGGMKTDTIIGKAFTQFTRPRIFRRYYNHMTAIVDRGNQILEGVASFVWGTKKWWALPDGRIIQLRAVDTQNRLYTYRGQPADFIAFDEATEFPETFVRFLMGWLRTTDPAIKPQVMMSFNPPTTAEGEWVIDFFKPWIDPAHPNPAKDGELRWFVTLKGKDVEVPDSEPVIVDGQSFEPRSRTFYHSFVQDNPYYMATGYDKQLASLDEPQRSQLLNGDFSIRVTDDEYQVIPMAWILAAMKRWEDGQRPELAQIALACDVARGGRDETTVATVYGTWFELFAVPGKETPDGKTVVDFIEKYEADKAPIWIDVTGVGSSPYDMAKAKFGRDRVKPFVAGGASTSTDLTKRYGFTNLRSQAWWKLREALHPESGQEIALPPLSKLRADLAAPRYTIVGAKYKVESKEEIFARLGRSTDYGDVAMMVWHAANRPKVNFEVLWAN